MRLILAVSADGYLARGSDDQMEWTGSEDKLAFRQLTSVGGVCAAGSTTHALMPRLPGRELIRLSRKPQEGSMGLGRLAYLHPDAWLLGGPTVALEAFQLSMVDEAFFCLNPTELGGGIAEDLRWRMSSRFWRSRAVATVGGVRVERWWRG